MQREKFYVKIVGIVFDPLKRRILIGKNKGDPEFSFVDGELNHNEELNSCLKRTIKEKTGYEISNLGSIFSGKSIDDNNELVIYFLCEVKNGQEKLGNNVEKIVWVKADEIEKLTNEKIPSRLYKYLKEIAG